MPKYILHYFYTNSRTQIARAILSYVKADWTNHIINAEKWPKIKKSGLCEFEQAPVLEVQMGKNCAKVMLQIYTQLKHTI